MFEYIQMSKIKRSLKNTSSLHARIQRLSSIHLGFAAAVAIQIVIFDAGRLIPPEVVLQRWIATGLFTGVVATVWYAARNRTSQDATLKKLVGALVAADICLASVAVYTQRGMASRAVALYAIPIIVAAAMNRRSAILASAMLSIAAYLATCVAYFVLHFNEGYKLELYGEAGFYSAVFIICGLCLWAVVKPSNHK